MERSFNLFNEFRYVVVAEPRTQAEGPCFDPKRRSRGIFGARAQPDAKTLVHNLLKGLAGLSGSGTEFCRHIIVKSQRRSHILMLHFEHQCVNHEPSGGFGTMRWFYKLFLRLRWQLRKSSVEQQRRPAFFQVKGC